MNTCGISLIKNLPSEEMKASTLLNFNELKFREHYVFSCMIKCKVLTLMGNDDIHQRLTRGRPSLSMGEMLTMKIRQPSHEFTFGVGISFIPYPLVLTPVV
jgi:hypothetical protein